MTRIEQRISKIEETIGNREEINPVIVLAPGEDADTKTAEFREKHFGYDGAVFVLPAKDPDH
jgi:hypothetical protein